MPSTRNEAPRCMSRRTRGRVAAAKVAAFSQIIVVQVERPAGPLGARREGRRDRGAVCLTCRGEVEEER